MEVEARQQLANDIGTFSRNPLGFVLYAFPWGRGALEGFSGPDYWQVNVLKEIGEKLGDVDSRNKAICEAVASGHGVGKSALVSWLVLWAVSTCPDTKGVVTANTETQLRTKTWAELAKWHRLCVCGSWFELTATALIAKAKGHEKTWRIDQVPWSERNTEAFAGLHNKGSRVLLIYDEASAIPDVIWEVSEGALTDSDTEILWCAFGNPTRNTGRFRECFGRLSHRWNCTKVDSRAAAMTNKEQLNAWIADYGEDSDFVRVRVRGEFPRAGSNQFISSEVVENAINREIRESEYEFAPKILGVDVARFGEDSSVITKRQGLRCIEQRILRNIDTMTLAGMVAEESVAWDADAVFVDGVGVGAGVVDRLRQLGVSVIDAQAGARAITPSKYANRRAEMWSKMRDWLVSASIPHERELVDDLTGIEYGFTSSGAIQLEKKEDMKRRGLSSPDRADSLALTFYSPVVERSAYREVGRREEEYDPLAW